MKNTTNRFKREKIHPYKLLTNCQFVTFVIVYPFVIRNWSKFLVISQTTWSGKVSSGEQEQHKCFLAFVQIMRIFILYKWKRFFYLKPNWNRWESFLIFRFSSTEMNLMWMDQIICTQDFRVFLFCNLPSDATLVLWTEQYKFLLRFVAYLFHSNLKQRFVSLIFFPFYISLASFSFLLSSLNIENG